MRGIVAMLYRSRLLAPALGLLAVALLAGAAVVAIATISGRAWAQHPGSGGAPQALPPEYAPPTGYSEWQAARPDDRAPPIPPHAEGPAVKSAGGGYCYVGGHPHDQSRAAGPAWHEDNSEHTHFYPPVDLRLFVLRGKCYHFVGDPQDFGHEGPLVLYYGAHPLPAGWGGHWCFMIGGHHHAFAPFAPQFALVGPYNHWQGAYDQVFWSYWPYYAYFYRTHYPQYYARGRFARAGGRSRAPAITQVPQHGGGHGTPSPPRTPGWQQNPTAPRPAPGPAAVNPPPPPRATVFAPVRQTQRMRMGSPAAAGAPAVAPPRAAPVRAGSARGAIMPRP